MVAGVAGTRVGSGTAPFEPRRPPGQEGIRITFVARDRLSEHRCGYLAVLEEEARVSVRCFQLVRNANK